MQREVAFHVPAENTHRKHSNATAVEFIDNGYDTPARTSFQACVYVNRDDNQSVQREGRTADSGKRGFPREAEGLRLEGRREV